MTNLLLVTIDCLRADRLQHLGARCEMSPHIDRLAAESASFTHTYATGPRTAESFPGILASTYPLSFGGTWRLPDATVPLAQLLRDSGYRTAAFHSNPFLSTNYGYDRGFERFWDSLDGTPATSRLGAQVMSRLNGQSRLYRLLRLLARQFETGVGISHYVNAEVVTNRAVDWLAGQPRPFFLWLHYMDMHYPFSPPERCIRQVRPGGISRRQRARLMVRTLEEPASVTHTEALAYRDLYDAGLLYVDESVGALVAALQQMGIWDDTILVLTADHGEEFREHGDFGHGQQIHVPDASIAPIKLHDELLHVPLLVRAPNARWQPRRIDALASLIDLPPTIVDLLGLAPDEAWQGLSLAPLLRGGSPVRAQVYSGYAVRFEGPWQPVVSCRTARWKYIHDGAFGRHQLYDLQADPLEHHNLYGEAVPALAELQEKVQEHLAAFGHSPATLEESQTDPAVTERLRGLGYLD